MNVARELGRSLKETYSLKPRFYILTSVVGLLGVAVGIGIIVVAAKILQNALGIDAHAPLGHQPKGIAWMALFLVAVPIAIYAGCALVAGSFGSIMVVLGKFTPREALLYALLSRYPRTWLKH